MNEEKQLEPRSIPDFCPMSISRLNHALRVWFDKGTRDGMDIFYLIKSSVSLLDFMAQADGLTNIRLSLDFDNQQASRPVALRGIVVWTGARTVYLPLEARDSFIRINGVPVLTAFKDGPTHVLDTILAEIERLTGSETVTAV